MTLCMVSWISHSHLAVPEEGVFFFPAKGTRVGIGCRPFDGAFLYSYSGEDYGWLAGDTGDQYRIVGQTPSGEIPVRKVYWQASEGGPFAGGVEDPRRFTRLEVSFEALPEHAVEEDGAADRLVEWAAPIAENFVTLYRSVSRRSAVRRFRSDDSPVIEVWRAEEYTFDEGLVEANFKRLGRVFKFEQVGTTGLAESPVDSSVLDTLGERVKKGEEANLAEKLLMDAREESRVNGNHDICIILSETAFEVFLQGRVEVVCQQRGIDTLERSWGDAQPVSRAVEEGQIRRELLNWAADLSDVPIKSKHHYRDWLEEAYRPRNEIVHRGRRDVEESEAQAAFEAVVEFINYLVQVLR